MSDRLTPGAEAREALALSLWDAGLVRPEWLAREVVDHLLANPILAASRPAPSPALASEHRTEWGVLCSDDVEATPTEAEGIEDAERIKAHHDRNCGSGHVVVARNVTPWVPASGAADHDQHPEGVDRG